MTSPANREKMRRVLILYTGGTIGMKMSAKGYIPVPHYFSGMLRSLPQFFDAYRTNDSGLPFITPPSEFGTTVAYELIEYSPLLDSCNMSMEDWGKIAQDIFDNYDRFDAFVILHGTDTMAFTASALSFMLQNLAKTVILTGSQIPVSEIRNDGIENMLGALLIAGNYDIPEVCLYFNNKLLRGNRSTKLDASSFDAFHSSNFPPLVEVGIDIKVNWPLVLSPPSSANFSIQRKMDPHVGALRLFPSITKKVILNFAKPPLKGFVLQTYGSGNAPDANKEFLSALKSVTDKGLIVVNCTQCLRGMVEDHYATGVALREAGVVGGADMTVEAALAKLSYLFAKGYPGEEIKRKLGKSLRGELTLARETTRFSFKDKDFIKSVAAVLDSDVGPVAEALSPVLMCSSATAGDVRQLKDLLDSGADINKGDYDLRTALHLAAAEGHCKAVEYLLQQGADANIRDRWGCTPLQDAIRHSKDDVATLLRKYGAQLHHDNLGEAMCAAAMRGDVEAIRRLVENGANPSISDYDNRSALHLAAAEGHAKVVEYLLAQGADANARDRWGSVPLQDAIRHGHDHIAGLLRQHGAQLSAENLGEAMCAAAMRGDVEAIRRLVENGANPSISDYDNRSALHLAAAEGHAKVVEYLLAQGADANARDRWGSVPLQDAIRHGHDHVTSLLRRYGAQLSQSNLGEAMCSAAMSGDIETIRRLIENGADPSTSDYDNRSALHLAAAEGHHEIVALLIDKGADVSARDRWGGTPLRDAVREGHDQIAANLRRHGAQLHHPNLGEAMCSAAMSGDVETIQRLVENGANPSIGDYDQRTALHLAAAMGHTKVVELLLSLGANVNAHDRWSGTPLKDAIRHKQDEISALLRRHGGQLHYANLGEAMCSAAMQGDVETIQRLVENIANPSIGDYDQRTALHLAAAMGHISVAEYLIAHGADVNALDRWGGTPLKDAIRHKQDEISALLRRHGGQLHYANLGEAMCSAAMQNDVETIRRLVENGANPSIGDYDQRTALHLASAMGHVPVAEYLISHGADVNAFDRWGGTPLKDAVRHKQDAICALLRRYGGQLHYANLGEAMCSAAMQNDVETIRRLVENGANPSIGDYDQRTALHLAAATGNIEVVKYLISHGADVNARDRWGGTPADDAVKQGRQEIVDTLIASS